MELFLVLVACGIVALIAFFGDQLLGSGCGAFLAIAFLGFIAAGILLFFLSAAVAVLPIMIVPIGLIALMIILIKVFSKWLFS